MVSGGYPKFSSGLPTVGGVAMTRTDAMNQSTIGLDQSELEFLASEVSDEALEAAASSGNDRVGNFGIRCGCHAEHLKHNGKGQLRYARHTMPYAYASSASA